MFFNFAQMTVLRFFLTCVGKFSTLKKVVKFDVFFKFWWTFSKLWKSENFYDFIHEKRGVKFDVYAMFGKNVKPSKMWLFWRFFNVFQFCPNDCFEGYFDRFSAYLKQVSGPWNRFSDLETGSRTLKQVLGPWNRFSADCFMLSVNT